MVKKLIAIRLRALIGNLNSSGKNGKKAGKGKIVAFSILFGYLGLMFAFFSFAMAMAYAPIMISLDLGWLYFTLFNLATFSVVFILSVFETKSELFECRDNELLLSMPIKPGDIVISRIFTVLLLNYVESAVLLLPAIIVYAAFGGGIVTLIGSLLVGLMIPLLATAVASGVGYVVALICARLKKNSFVTLFISVIFLLLYFFGYSYFMEGLDALLENEGAVIDLSVSLSFLRGIGAASTLELLPFVVMLLLTAVITVVAFFLISRHYIRILTASVKTGRVKYKARVLLKKSAFLALTKKELARFFSSAAYMLNAGMGIIFEIIIAVMIIVNRDTVLALGEEIAVVLGVSAGELLTPISVGILVALASTVYISASALSLEGKALWLLKTAPVRPIDVIHSKLAPHLILTVPASVITSVIMAVSIGADALGTVFIIVTPLLANFLIAVFGLVINIAMPKFNFENDAQLVKQSGAATIVSLSGLLFGTVVMLGAFFLSLISPILSLCVITGIIILLCVILYFVLTGPCLKKIERI